MQKLLFIITILMLGCVPKTKIRVNKPIAENNKDVLILSMQLRTYLRQTRDAAIDLNTFQKSDTFKRITKNFEKVEMRSKGSYIAVNFKFSSIRDIDKIQLSEKEKEMLSWNIWKEKQIDEAYDGFIQYNFGERLYNIRKIVVRK